MLWTGTTLSWFQYAFRDILMGAGVSISELLAEWESFKFGDFDFDK